MQIIIEDGRWWKCRHSKRISFQYIFFFLRKFSTKFFGNYNFLIFDHLSLIFKMANTCPSRDKEETWWSSAVVNVCWNPAMFSWRQNTKNTGKVACRTPIQDSKFVLLIPHIEGLISRPNTLQIFLVSDRPFWLGRHSCAAKDTASTINNRFLESRNHRCWKRPSRSSPSFSLTYQVLCVNHVL